MIACAEWLGRSNDTCTRGQFCVCKNLAMRESDCNADASLGEAQRTLMPPDTSNRTIKENTP